MAALASLPHIPPIHPFYTHPPFSCCCRSSVCYQQPSIHPSKLASQASSAMPDGAVRNPFHSLPFSAARRSTAHPGLVGRHVYARRGWAVRVWVWVFGCCKMSLTPFSPVGRRETNWAKVLKRGMGWVDGWREGGRAKQAWLCTLSASPWEVFKEAAVAVSTVG